MNCFFLRSIHVGERAFHRGYHSYVFLNESVMVSKKPWLEEVLRSGQMEVLIYNGNLVRRRVTRKLTDRMPSVGKKATLSVRKFSPNNFYD